MREQDVVANRPFVLDGNLLAHGGRIIALIWIPVLALLFLTHLFSRVSGVNIRQLTQDPTTVLGAPFYIGIISNIGIVLWAATASICLFCSVLLARLINQPWRNFLLISGALTAVLLFDDFFLLHDDILPNYVGISGDAYGLVYVLVMGLYLLRFRALILRSDYLLFGAAIAFFMISAGVDIVHKLFETLFSSRTILLVEDGAKLMGIAHWLAYFALLSAALINERALSPLQATVARAMRRER